MGLIRRLILTGDLYGDLLSHARAARPREAVGLLGGSADGTATRLLPLSNIAPGNKAFVADPFEQFCALRRLQSEMLQLLAIYHSHPDGGTKPSQDDLAFAGLWRCAHLIVALGLSGEAEARLGAFRFDGSGRFTEVKIHLPSCAHR
jgi:proteasome lid subunit RPN8/RPN11